MGKNHSFRFLDGDLNDRFIALLNKARIKYTIDQVGAAHYSPDDVAIVENELLSSIRHKVFPSWQILTCPRDWAGRYRDYMSGHRIPFREELSNGELWFLIPRK